ncbi:hypothetical protein ASPVEDRAFT_26316 [Aspergillus versicolor CBS 583.65]|uniref:DUF7730 domain-containing protein n=1 Tax=Aspergillus versicolor CBS 583.65 TaxID=1036611 RepID=A0A1L9PDB5_ASPVE|nr:uncharacterized protein ASPVEDRAFT_26316 [Aspergillus versicolor CBS 583.65]OJI99506.1 hypothetical protein ASPVEDRAFT_26316 [Aspergillus versicolor CBS 583.65]
MGKRKHPASTKSKTSKHEEPTPKAKKRKVQSKPMHNQGRSLFFRLPQEIRDMIYKEIFIFPETVHIAWVGGRKYKFRSFLCKLPMEAQLEYDRVHPLPCICSKDHFACSPRAHSRTFSVKSTRTPAETRKLRAMSMLQSCKRIYTETIEMLYTQNNFYISNPRTALELPKYMPQSRLSLFRHLAVESPPWGDLMASRIIERWKEVVDALRMFNGLQTLWILLRPAFGLNVEIQDLMGRIDEGALAVRPRITTDAFIKMAPAQGSKREICPRHPDKTHAHARFLNTV